MWLVTSLAQLPGVDPAVAGRRFAALLPAPGARRPGAAAREPACVQLLKLFILDRPAAASALVAQDAGALGRFFEGPRRRTELWFGHFGHGGNVGSFRFGAGALARFALQHRSEARPARPPRRAGAASRCLRRPQPGARLSALLVWARSAPSRTCPAPGSAPYAAPRYQRREGRRRVRARRCGTGSSGAASTRRRPSRSPPSRTTLASWMWSPAWPRLQPRTAAPSGAQ